jgi:hypothetical protein
MGTVTKIARAKSHQPVAPTLLELRDRLPDECRLARALSNAITGAADIHSADLSHLTALADLLSDRLGEVTRMATDIYERERSQ